MSEAAIPHGEPSDSVYPSDSVHTIDSVHPTSDLKPMSAQDCEDHVRSIANQLTCNEFVREGFQGALDLIAADLYKDSSHFLLELIQNADDNTYEDGVPEASFFWRGASPDGAAFLYFGCNEKGFTPANLAALCSANRSTKKFNKGKKGSIGEKGIGFKSVFKVANSVWVKSGNYTFQFDKRQPLGMITPIWTDFPDLPEAYRYNTMFCIKIEGKHHRNSVYDQLRALEPTILMFLRRLSRVKLVFADEVFNVTNETTLACDQEPRGDVSLATTSKAEKRSSYILADYVVKDMPAEEKRPNISESTIVIAFPVDGDWAPVYDVDQYVHAFLPICSSGFPFIIQADFLLVSSRQDIDTSNLWNRRLRDRFVHALVAAFAKLNATALKYTWPRFVPRSKSGRHPFLGFVIDQLIRHLRTESVLEGWQEGTFNSPSDLCFLPPEFLDDAGQPLLYAPSHLSPRYAPEDLDRIVTKTYTGSEFVAAFKNFVSKQRDAFRNKPNKWHSRVCKALLEAMQIIPRKDELAHIVMTPLSNGTWTSSHKKIIYLPEVPGDVPIPSDIEIVTVEAAAAQDTHRKGLYRWLGAKVLDYEDVSKKVIEKHQAYKGRPELPVELLVTHAQYLFRTPDGQVLPPGLQRKLWVADTEGIARHGNELYTDAPDSRPVSDYFKSNPNIAPFIHNLYLEVYAKELGRRDRWYAWLQKNLGISAHLRLASADKTDISPEFAYIIKNNPSPQWLHVLRDNCLYRTPPKDEEKIREKIANLAVDCTDGSRLRLRDTFLPTLVFPRPPVTETPLDQAAKFKFVTLEEEGHTSWSRLGAFGVVAAIDLQYPIRLLLGLQQAHFYPLKADIEWVYRLVLSKRIGSKSDDTIRDLFKKLPLVYAARPYFQNLGQWLRLESCCWDAPDCLRKVRALKQYFSSDLRHLFQNILGVRDATVDMIVNELVELDSDMHSIAIIKSMLLALSSQIMKAPPRADFSLRELERHKLIPVKSKDGQVMLVTLTDRRWYIPDRASFQTVFNGKVHLLDFTLREQEDLEPLIGKINATDRKISNRVIENLVIKDKEKATINAKFTNAYREKVKYILALVPEFEEARIMHLLLGMEIYGVDSIILHRSIRTNQQNLISGIDEVGDVVVEPGLKIYISKKDLGEHAIATYKLASQLCLHINISPNHRDTVSQILAQNSPRHIEDMLERANINWEKRVKEITNIKLIDDSAGIIIPKASVVPTSADTTKSGGRKMAPPSKPQESQINALAAPRGVALPHKKLDTEVVPPKREGIATTSEAKQDQKTLQQEIQTSIDERNRLQFGKEPRPSPTPAYQPPSALSYQAVHTSEATSKPRTVTCRSSGLLGVAKSVGASRNTFSVPDDHIHEIVDSPSSSSSSSPSKLTTQPSRSSLTSRRGSSTPGSSTASTSDDAEAVRIGEQGEFLVYKFLQKIMKHDFNEENWTSMTRRTYTSKVFEGDDSQCADFTIEDTSDNFTQWLVTRGHQQAQRWLGSRVNYHLEVKSTYGPRCESFHFSQNQLDLARKWQVLARVPKDVYVVLRVSNMTGKTELFPYVDPATMFDDGSLTFIAPEGYHVFAT